MIDENTNRRKFLQIAGLTPFVLTTINFPIVSNDNLYGDTLEGIDLKSLPVSKLFDVIDLELPKLRSVQAAYKEKGHHEALIELLEFLRLKYEKTDIVKSVFNEEEKEIVSRADNICRHVFQWGPYDSKPYGDNIDWSYDPAGDIEWVAAVYRFYWAVPLLQAYELTGNDKYVKSFCDLTEDWIQKHPLETTLHKSHPVYSYWKGYVWLDLQTGIRATNITRAFRSMVHSSAFSPKFLGLLLASLYDHENKTVQLPMNRIHNKAIFEQRGFVNVIYTFPIYKDFDNWINLAIFKTLETLLPQTTSDGVQKEWCGGYHLAVFRDLMEIQQRLLELNIALPLNYMRRHRKMAEYIFWISTPDLGFPMFGDTYRYKIDPNIREDSQLYSVLKDSALHFHDSKFSDLAELKIDKLPQNASKGFFEAGYYALRTGWSPDDIYVAIHNSPIGITGHDSADNGVFELFAYGKWLMPDSGYYVYGRDKPEREWHRQTWIHPTLTLDRKDTLQCGRHLDWSSNNEIDVVCFENESYPRFFHRRTMWLADKNSNLPFVFILDEALGHLEGDFEINFPLAPGDVDFDEEAHEILTDYDDEINLLINTKSSNPNFKFEKNEGWTAWGYGKRERRHMVSAICSGRAPLSFVSLLIPYKGKDKPRVNFISNIEEYFPGDDEFEFSVEINNKKHTLNRTLSW